MEVKRKEERIRGKADGVREGKMRGRREWGGGRERGRMW